MVRALLSAGILAAAAAASAAAAPWSVVLQPAGGTSAGEDGGSLIWIGLRNGSARARIVCGDEHVGMQVYSRPVASVRLSRYSDHECSTAWSWHLVGPQETLFFLQPLPDIDRAGGAALGISLTTQEWPALDAKRTRAIDRDATFGHWSVVPPATAGDAEPGSWAAVVQRARSTANTRSYWLGLENRSSRPRGVCGYVAGAFSPRGGRGALRRRRGPGGGPAGCRQGEPPRVR